MDNIVFLDGETELLEHIATLWENLNEFHRSISPHFKEVIQKRTYHTRKEELLAKSRTGKLRVDVALTHDEREIVGYCVSTVDDQGNGEIDSIFVEEAYRCQGIARRLMTSAISWMNDLGVEQKRVVVAFGNDGVLDFYAKFGLCPRSYLLANKPND